MMRRWWCACVTAAAVVVVSRAGSVFDLIRDNGDLSEFLSLVKTDSLLMNIMKQLEGTVFAPNNEAMTKYSGNRTYHLLKYHLVNLALSTDQLKAERTVLTRLKGSQPVFVTEPRHGDIFINNARIVRGNIRATSQQNQQEQVLHIIDEVLEPTIPIGLSSRYFNPSALELLANSNKYDLGDSAVTKFYQMAQDLEKINVFNMEGSHTYFIPIDVSFDTVRDRFNDQVLDGHVIPNRMLFTRTMGNDTYRTMAFDDTLQVTIRLRSEPLPSADDHDLNDIQSSTLLGDSRRPTGSVLARLVKPNIAVKNGVVHLIQKPLMLMDSDVLHFIQDGAHGRFQRFYGMVREHASNFIETLMTATYVTLFVPSNEAFRRVDQNRLSEIEKSPEKLMALLSLHLVRQKVTTDDVRKAHEDQAGTGPYSVPSDDKGRSLLLSVTMRPGAEPTLTVDGGGTNATVVVPKISLYNGIVHVIDHILGIPYRSVGDRLTVDPLASATNTLVSKSGLSASIRRMDEKFTMFVPSNTAWERLQTDLPASHETLFSGKVPRQAMDILKRHLVSGHAYDMEQLALLSAKEGGVKTDNGQVKVEHIPGSLDYLVNWEGMETRVRRGDEECTNGYIHVIDAVLMNKGDVTSAAAATSCSAALVLAAWTILRL